MLYIIFVHTQTEQVLLSRPVGSWLVRTRVREREAHTGTRTVHREKYCTKLSRTYTIEKTNVAMNAVYVCDVQVRARDSYTHCVQTRSSFRSSFGFWMVFAFVTFPLVSPTPPVFSSSLACSRSSLESALFSFISPFASYAYAELTS